MSLKVKLLDESAIAPARQTPKAAGYDIYALEDTCVPAGEIVPVRTGWACAIPAGYVGLIKSRSGTAKRELITAEAGVIDEDYRGEVIVLLHNNKPPVHKDVKYDVGCFNIRAGDRIAQMVVVKNLTSRIEIVYHLDSTDRGTGGFGSTGI